MGKHAILKPIAAVLSAWALMVSGCTASPGASSSVGSASQAQPSAAGSSAPAQPEEQPYVISVASVFYSAEVPAREDVVALLEEASGYQLSINWIPTTGYGDKINAMIASDTLPMITVITGNKDSAYVAACRSGMFWEIEPYLSNYPNISALDPGVFNNVRIDGKLYGIFRERPLVRQGIIYREDWLEEEGLAVPKSVDMILDTIRAFSKKCDYGVSLGSQNGYPEGVDYVAIWNGSPNGWGVDEDGKVKPSFFFKEFESSMDIFRQLYADGLINKNFAEIPTEDGKKLMNTEQTGFQFIYTDDIVNRFQDLYKKNPNARLMYGLDIAGQDGGKRAVATTGYNGVFSFSKSAVKTEEDLKKCLDFVDKMALPAYADVIQWGVESIDYVIKDGLADRSEQKYADSFNQQASQYGQLSAFDSRYELKGKMDPILETLIEERKQYNPIAVHNAINPYISQTDTELGGDLNQIRNDGITRYIMGVIDKAGWEAVKENWLSSGGEKVIEEYTQTYQAAQS